MSRAAPPPAWARLVALVPDFVPAALSVVTVVLVALLDVDAFYSGLIYPAAVIAALVTLVVVARLAYRSGGPPVAVWWDLAGIAVAVAFFVANVRYNAQHLFVDRDPGTYATTAQYLVHHASLPVHTDPSAFAPGVDFSAAGYQNLVTLGDVSPQGMHGTPAVLAAVGRLFGSATMLKANVLIGAVAVLAVYAFARRVIGGLWAVVAALALSLSMPQIHFARDAFSEPLGEVALWVGLALFVQVQRARGPAAAYFAAAFVFAGGMTTRIDGFLAWTGPLALAGFLLAEAKPGARGAAARRAAAVLAGTLIPFVIGLVDLQRLSSKYYEDSSTQVHQVETVIGVVLVVAALAVAACWWRPAWPRWVSEHRTTLGLAGAAAVVLVFLAFVVRPVFGAHHDGGNSGLETLVGFLQKGEHRAYDPTRDYAEHAWYWSGYYLGITTVALGSLGLALLVFRLFRCRPDLLVVVATILPTTFGYLAKPSISSDQIWAVRRFLPLTIPAFVIGAAAIGSFVGARALSWVVRAYRRRRARAAPRTVGHRSPAGSVAAASGMLACTALAVQAVWVPVAVSSKLFAKREYNPELATVRKFCDAIGEHAAVLGVDTLAQQLTVTIRAFCGAPAASLADPTREDLATQARAAAAQGRTLWIYGSSAQALAPFDGVPAATPTITLKSRAWGQTLVGPPKSSSSYLRYVYLAKVRPDGSAELLPPR